MKFALNFLIIKDKGNIGKFNWYVLIIFLFIFFKKMIFVYNVILFFKILIFIIFLKLKNI